MEESKNKNAIRKFSNIGFSKYWKFIRLYKLKDKEEEVPYPIMYTVDYTFFIKMKFVKNKRIRIETEFGDTFFWDFKRSFFFLDRVSVKMDHRWNNGFSALTMLRPGVYRHRNKGEKE